VSKAQLARVFRAHRERAKQQGFQPLYLYQFLPLVARMEMLGS